MIHLHNVKKETNIRGITAQTLVDVKPTIIKALTLKAHQAIPPHKVPVFVTFYVLEGAGTIQIGEQSFAVTPHTVVTCPEHTVMAVQASDEGLLFLNIKTPGFKPQA